MEIEMMADLSPLPAVPPDLTNAFAEVGVGFGYTMFAGHYAVRIDHVMVPKTLVVERVELLRGYPSEHQPVVVDIGRR